jgi:hypothetical protein
VDVVKNGRKWRIGTAADVAWIAGRTTHGISITTAIPPLFEAYASFYEPDGVDIGAHERAVVDELTDHTADQPWWLGYLETGLDQHRRQHGVDQCSAPKPVDQGVSCRP